MKVLLIVDDEKFIADGLYEMLTVAFSGRLEVLCCYSSAEAMAIFEKKRVDVLLTDINMPDISGLQLHALIGEGQPECKVIYLTGYSQFEYARTALIQHAFAYVLKGEGDDVVVSTIERAIVGGDGQTLDELAVPDTEEPAQKEWLMRINAYINDHLSEDLSLHQLAEVIHFHPVYLSRIYKETTGKALSDVINQAKLAKACQLLRESELSVLDISWQTGFATANYFCRWFRKNMNVTPQSYRATKKKGAVR